MHYFAYFISYILWSVWSTVGRSILPPMLLPSFICETAMKSLIWIGPMLLIKRRKYTWMIHPVEMIKTPFPWFATFVGLCLTVAFLHTAHILMVGINVWGIFDPMWIAFSLSAAVIEEIAFRSLLFNGQAGVHGVRTAAVLNGIMFAVYHYPEFLIGQSLFAVFGLRFWVITIMGIVFSLSFARWRNLLMNIVIHFVWNMLCFWFALA